MSSDEELETFAGISMNALKCSLCNKHFNKPKFLTCLHTFCLKCLKNWVKKNNGVLECPTCHAPHDIPEGGIQKFPTNGVMRGLVDHMTGMQKTEPQLCSTCPSEATDYCTNCDYFYCEACVAIHKHAKKTNMHTVITLQDYKDLGAEKQLAHKILFCKEHNQVDLKLYCEKCQVSICIECAHVQHKNQEHVIKDGSQVFKEFVTNASQKLIESEAKEAELRQTEDKLKLVKTSLLQNKENCHVAIQEHFGAIQRLLDAQKAENLKELDEIFDGDINRTNHQLREVDSIIIQLQSTRELTQNLVKSPNVTLALMNANMISSQVGVLLKFKMDVQPVDDAAWKFFPVNTFREELQSGHVGKIKHISPDLSTIDITNSRVLSGENVSFTLTTKETHGEKCYDNANNITSKMTSPSGDDINLDVVDNENGTYAISGSSCDVPGEWKLTVLIGSQIVGGSPMKVNVVESGFQSATCLKDYCNQGELHNINVIDKAIFACFSRNRNIAKLSKNGVELIDMRYIGGSKVLSLCGGNPGEIICACHDITSHEGRIIVCEHDGTFIREFKGIKLGRVQGMMAVKDNEIYIPDNDKNCVLRVSLSGQLLAKIPSGSPSDVLKFPKGVAVTQDGHLLVCSYWKNQVVMFDKSGVFIKVFVDKGEDTDGKVYSPYSVAVDEQDNVVIGSLHRLQLFSKDGVFVKRIDDDKHMLYCPGSIICKKRQVIAADKRNASICVYNY
ncbi:E3 ubiquitin-protein ligase TRIM45-like [Antedon mediterranea]|uniref:E3 ubiquitin-protein ligase TRIM45-like n=1 Tax=Antedon mediterranea TaxID=105859 RepID=UPI003AF8A10D